MRRNSFAFIISTLLSLCSIVTHAQYYNQQENYLKANGAWAFGLRGGLHFYTGKPVPARTDMHMVSNFPQGSFVREGCAAVGSPQDGKFLFYAGGGSVWNRTHSLMPNGTLLEGDIYGSTVQGKCIVPFIDDPSKYYLFSLSSEASVPSLFYSVIDTSLDNGLGDVAPGWKNIVLDTDSLSEAMIAVPGNNCDIWLITHQKGRPVFKVWHITANGIDPIPALYQTGSQISGNESYHHAAMAISPNRSLLALTTNQSEKNQSDDFHTGTLICRFDANTGAVSDAIKISPYFGYGLTFSPDNTKLYVTNPTQVSVIGGTTVSRSQELVQYEVDVFDSATIVQSAVSITNQIGLSLKLYNDTIYACHNQQPYISRINRPNEKGLGCNFEHAAIPLLSGTTAYMGLPNDVVFPLPSDTNFIQHDTIILCSDDEGVTLSAPNGYEEYFWNNGYQGRFQWTSEAGTYYVISRSGCNIQKDIFHVIRMESLKFSLGSDTILCQQVPLTLTIPISDANYHWQDGSTNRSYSVKTDGQYIATVEKNNCIASDTINVRYEVHPQDLGPDHKICMGKPFAIELRANAPSHGSTVWSTGATSATIAANHYDTYFVTVSVGDCFFSDTIKIVPDEICDCFIEAPSAFSPNGDGLNDLFRPVITPNCPITEFSMHVYNRWGQLVYRTFDPLSGWDGVFKGEPADMGVYMYYIQFKGGAEGTQKELRGDLMLVR